MTRPDFIRKLTDILDEAERTQMFGSIEIEIRAGRPTVVRTTKTDLLEKLDRENSHHANKFQR